MFELELYVNQDIIHFLGKHTGDLYIRANCMLLTETYIIQDYIDYQPMVDNSHESKWTIPSAVSSSSIFGYSNNGWKYGNASSFSTITYYKNINRPYCVEFTVTDGNNGQPIFGALIGSAYIFADRVNNQLRINVYGSTTYYDVSYQSTYTVRYELTDNTFSVYIDNTLIATVNHNLTGDSTPALQTGSNRYVVIKDFKIKPL